jgi:hypothetical protein
VIGKSEHRETGISEHLDKLRGLSFRTAKREEPAAPRPKDNPSNPQDKPGGNRQIPDVGDAPMSAMSRCRRCPDVGDAPMSAMSRFSDVPIFRSPDHQITRSSDL